MNVNMLIARTKKICTTIYKIGQLYKDKYEILPNIKECVIMDIYQRIYANLHASIALLEGDKNGKNFNKLPLAVLIRATLNDCLTGAYLVMQDDVQFEEEIDVINLSFVKYVAKTLPCFIDFEDKIERARNNNANTRIPQNIFDEHHPYFRRYLNSDIGSGWDVKKNDSFRSNKSKAPLTTKYIGDWIKERSSDTEQNEVMSDMYLMYKFFSQYEHYTYIGRETTILSMRDELHLFYGYSIIQIEQAVLFMSQALKDEDAQQIIGQWQEHQD